MRRTIRQKLVLGCFLVLCLAPATAARASLGAAWATPYRTSASPPQVIKVYLCIDTFNTWFPTMDKTQLRTALEHTLWLWNTYGAVDFSLRSYGDRTGTAGGCSPNTLPAPGEIALRAEQEAGSSGIYGITCTDEDTNCGGNGSGNITSAAVTLYAQDQSTHTPFAISFYTDGVSLNETALMNHEFGHALGLGHVSPPVKSIMDTGQGSGTQQVLWHDDVVTLRSGIANHYNQVTTRQVQHMVGNTWSWAPEGNLLEYTNLKIGVANNPAAPVPSYAQYLVAWTGTDDSNTVNTILGNGAVYDAASKVIHSGFVSHYGPAIVRGNQYVLAAVVPNDSRHIMWKHSNDGISWGLATEVLETNSMAEPALAWNASKGAYVLAWAEWANDSNAGTIHVCTNRSPDSTNFADCVSTGVRAHTSPSVACINSTLVNECLVSWSEITMQNGLRICHRKGKINGSDQFVWSNNAVCSASQKTNAPPSLSTVTFGYLLGYRGLDGYRTGNYWWGTQTSWSGPALVVPLLQASPGVVYGYQFNEVAYYYVNYSPE